MSDSVGQEYVFEYYESLRKLRQFIEVQGLGGLTQKRAAEIAGMETTYFSKFFHAKVGVTFREWRQAKRVMSSITRLQSTDDQITLIAFESGFEDVSSFQRAFRRVVEMSPREFRKRNSLKSE